MPAVKFSRALYDFEAFLDVEKNLSPRTREAYIYDLERFVDFWIKRKKQNPTVENIGTPDIKRYLEHLRMNLNYKSTTLSRTIASIRIFFEFCVTQGFLKNSPAALIHNPKTPRKLPVFLVESETRRLMEAPRTSEKENARYRSDYKDLWLRDCAIIATLAFTGVRLQELVGLNVRDIDLERKNIRVLGKGSKERLIPLNVTVIGRLREWLEVREPADASEEAVFLNRFHRRISRSGVEKLVKKYVRKSGIDKDRISPHKLRHTFATLLHVRGVDIVEIQALMGHAAITSTQIYTHTDSGRLQAAVKKLDEVAGNRK